MVMANGICIYTQVTTVWFSCHSDCFITEVLTPCIIDCLTPFKLIPIKVNIHTGYQVMNNKNIQNIKSNKSVIITTRDLQHLIGILQGINSLLTMKRFM